MNKGELKPLDWVTFLGKNYQINFAGGDIMYLVGRNKYVATVDLSPIPLTEEVLEKNGWEERERPEGIVYVSGWYKLSRVGQNASWTFSHYDDFLTQIWYVHELQHLLWALGIDDDLKI